MKRNAIAFDFDGTLIRNGLYNLDKGVHILYSSWTACAECGMADFLQFENILVDVEKMTNAYIRYPGSPRFEQLAAIVNSLINSKFSSVPEFSGFGIAEKYRNSYEQVREYYNSTYSALNDIAAELFWKPYPSVKETILKLNNDFDLYIASGVTQDILEEDFERHGFNRKLFCGIYGGNRAGGNDKGTILTSLKDKGYENILFIADSNKDLEYAKIADVNFYRIKNDDDYQRLQKILPTGIPDEKNTWDFTAFEIDFFRSKTETLLEQFRNGNRLSPKEITTYINKE